MTLVDSNALLDIFTADPVWCDWSTGKLDAASLRGPLCINDVIYAELSVRFDRIEVLDSILAEMKLGRRPIPAPALFLAYERNQGQLLAWERARKERCEFAAARTVVMPAGTLRHSQITANPLNERGSGKDTPDQSKQVPKPAPLRTHRKPLSASARNKSFFASFFSKKEESSFSEEKEAKRLLFPSLCSHGGCLDPG